MAAAESAPQTVPLTPAERKLFNDTIDRLRSVQCAKPRTEVRRVEWRVRHPRRRAAKEHDWRAR